MLHKGLLSLIVLMTAGASALVVLGLTTTNPGRLGPVGVTLWFFAVWGSLAGILTILFNVAKSRGYSEELPSKKLATSLRQGVLASAVVVITLGLSSLHQLSLRDAILIVILAGLIEFYFRTRA